MNILVYTVHFMNIKKKEDDLTLGILETIERNKHVTQRHMADELNVALGLTNSYLKRCVKKGLIKIHQAPANRYFYYLTPKGFAEKSRLTAEYLSASFDFYRKAGSSINTIFIQCRELNFNRIMLCGISELAEIARLKAIEAKIEITGIFDPYATTKTFIHLPVWKYIDESTEFDACVLTALKDVDTFSHALKEKVPINKLFIPEILPVSNRKP